MKKLAALLILLAVLSVVFATSVMAGGGQVRGENGQGSVNQIQIQDPPPFQ